MKLERIDNEMYLKRETVVLFKSEVIPEKYKDQTKFAIVRLTFDKK